MDNYISREAALDFHIPTYDLNISVQDERLLGDRFEEFLKSIPAADVVARNCYDRILAENDTMREMLAGIGKKPGDKMDDVRPVVRGKWIRGNENRTSPIKDSYTCSVCGEKTLSGFCGNPAKTNFCPNCGADMRGTNLDTTKGDNHG
jgi:hypothetical protein